MGFAREGELQNYAPIFSNSCYEARYVLIKPTCFVIDLQSAGLINVPR